MKRGGSVWRPSRDGLWPVVHTAGDLELGEQEWLHTNEIGAYAMSTLPVMHTRRHHGTLVAALSPPLGRHVIVSHAETTVTVDADKRTYRLSTHQFPHVAPTLGYRLMEYFAQDPIPRWVFRLGQHTLERTLCLARHHNTCVMSYTWHGKASARISIRPLMPLRPADQLMTEHGGMMQVVTLRSGAVELRPVPTLPPVHFVHDGMFMGSPDWWRRFEYRHDRTEHRAYQEDIWTPGVFEIYLEPGRTVHLMTSVGELLDKKPLEIVHETAEFLRSQDLGQKHSAAVRVLGVAAEQFCVDYDHSAVVVAGYPSHAIFTRDLLISIPGLFFAREQPERAVSVIETVIKQQRFGLLPSLLPTPGQRRSMPLPDATLLLFDIAQKLVTRLGPKQPFVRDRLYRALVRAFLRMDQSRRRQLVWRSSDGLLVTAERGVALTWMDARVDGQPVTPRAGIAIEHQALWSRGAELLSTLARFYGHEALALRASRAAAVARAAFRSRFWCQETEYPYDCVSEGRDIAEAWSDRSVRPNALIALAIDPTLFEDWQADTVLQRVRNELLTPRGVRSLSPSDARYTGHFGGSTAERECAYHQGTAWVHLLGFYARAAHHQWGDEVEGREELIKLLEDATDDAGLLGQLSQLADGDAPHRPRGAPAQAMAVAELLRALIDLGR